MYFTTYTYSLFFVPQYIFFLLILDLIKLCTPDSSRVNFATELSTNLVYKSIFVIN